MELFIPGIIAAVFILFLSLNLRSSLPSLTASWLGGHLFVLAACTAMIFSEAGFELLPELNIFQYLAAFFFLGGAVLLLSKPESQARTGLYLFLVFLTCLAAAILEAFFSPSLALLLLGLPWPLLFFSAMSRFSATNVWEQTEKALLAALGLYSLGFPLKAAINLPDLFWHIAVLLYFFISIVALVATWKPAQNHEEDAGFDQWLANAAHLMNMTYLSLFIINTRGQFVFANTSTCRLLGIQHNHPENSKLDDFMIDKEQTGHLLKGILQKTQKVQRSTNWLSHKNGATFLGSIILTPMFRQGRETVILGILEDISKSMMQDKQKREYTLTLEERLRGQNQELTKKNKELALKNRELINLNKSKDIFFANVSHELRTPLVAVCGYVEMLLEEKLGPINAQIQTAFSTAEKNLQRLTSFINNLLDLARIEAFRENIAYQRVSLYQIAEMSITQFKTQADQKGIQLINSVSSNFPPVYVSQRHIEQIIFNLLSNSIKYSREGYVKISAQKQEGKRVTVSIEDTGIGIPDEEKAHIFDRFYQVERNKADPYQGTGLGLAIVREVVNLYNSRIHIDDRPGGGSIFSFNLYSEAPQKNTRRLNRRILSVSSNEEQNKIIRNFFQTRGFQVFVAENGLGALDQIGKQDFDIVFSDLLLPDLEGAEICKVVNKRNEKMTTPVYITTFPISEEERNNLILCGAKGIVSKPFDDQALERVLKDELTLYSELDQADELP